MHSPGTILITGGSGFLGKLIAAILLVREQHDLLLPVRGGHDPNAVIRAIAGEVEACGTRFTDELAARVRIVTLPPVERLNELDDLAAATGALEIVHAAGCLDYFDGELSHAVNVELTARLIERAQRWRVKRFTYVSTAFCSGYVDGEIRECLHAEEQRRDPTVYTRTKRIAESLVAGSGVPYLIVRPSIVIGDSRDGRYTGKQYGLYQLWAGAARLLCSSWEPEFHVVAPRQALNVIHQDAFQLAFQAARRELPDGSIIHIVAKDGAPTLRDLWDAWLERVFKPERVFYYDRVDELPVRDVPRRQRALMALGSVNMEIGCHPWRFERASLDALCANGLDFPDVTPATVERCQQVFIENAPRVQAFMRKVTQLSREREPSSQLEAS